MSKFRAVTIFITLLLAMLALAGMARAQSYGPDVTNSTYAISCGYTTTYYPANAFNNSLSEYWRSSQSGTAIKGNACIGQDFGESAYHIRRISIYQNLSPATDGVDSLIVQNSTDCNSWNSVQTISTIKATQWYSYDIDPSMSCRCWRLLAFSEAESGKNWGIFEIQMMELLTWPTDTPGPTDTPTITLTPSTTPSPTPDYFIALTSTQGAPFRLERAASFGDVLSTSAICVVGAIVTLGLFVSFWGRRPGNA